MCVKCLTCLNQETSNNLRSLNIPVLQPPRAPANGIKIIPKAGSFAIRIPASKVGPRTTVGISPQPKRPPRRQSSLPRPEPAPSSVASTSTKPLSATGDLTSNTTKAPSEEDELSPAEIVKLKKIKELILAKGEDELMKFLRS
jgi:hypothetical protein